MDKYTIIIPTLWKSHRTQSLLNDLINCESILEIIIIDNSGLKITPVIHSKIKYVQQNENLFVARSWNLGVELAQSERICILNDDVNFNTNIFSVMPRLEGFIGQSSENYNYKLDDEPIIETMITSRPWGWGCMIFTEKKYWWPIPNELKVWYNDDYIIEINPYPKYILKNFKIETEMSTSGDSPEFDIIKQEDTYHWQKIRFENFNK